MGRNNYKHTDKQRTQETKPEIHNALHRFIIWFIHIKHIIHSQKVVTN